MTKNMIREFINIWFTYHAPKQEDIKKFERIRSEAKKFAEMINEICPPGMDKAHAISLIREVVMYANASIACKDENADKGYC